SWSPDTAWHTARVDRLPDGATTWLLDGSPVFSFNFGNLATSDYFAVHSPYPAGQGVFAELRNVELPAPAVPEPASLALCAAGLLLGARIQRRRGRRVGS
ncbi:MAG TPA: PEP-CTERM sorting domain-containing protein, partial [Planctomycetota bacterium]|nr:PEP-CTERM sorting domain-containing protein [Planctomycetota bacterium]